MYSVTIIGGGAISCGYDSPNSENVLTHLNAVIKHAKFTLDCIIENNLEQHQNIKDKWGKDIKIFDKLTEALNYFKSDVVIIATPTNTHFSIIKNLLEIFEPKLLICEKPIVSTLEEFNLLNILMNNVKTKLITNFPRRFDPGINLIKDFLKNINNNDIHHFHATFPKGFLHNGSHLVALLHQFFGNVDSLTPNEYKIINDDIFGNFFVKTPMCNGFISNFEDNTISLFELTIYLAQAKIEISGPKQLIKISHRTPSTNIATYDAYENIEEIPNTLNKSSLNMLEACFKILKGKLDYNLIFEEQQKINKQLFELKINMMEQQCQI